MLRECLTLCNFSVPSINATEYLITADACSRKSPTSESLVLHCVLENAYSRDD